MNLIVDIGNSSAKAAVFDGSELVLRKRIDGHWAQELKQLAADFKPEACAWAVVGPEEDYPMDLLQQLAPWGLHVTGATPTPLHCDYDTPQTLGADRLAAAVGAASLRPQTDLLIVDVGTCITYDFVQGGERYLGGNISPGVGMRLRALHEQTARLPLVQADKPAPPVGRDTETAIRAGVLQGIDHEIKGYIRRFLLDSPQGCVFITGGNGPRFAREIHVERHDALVEWGLNSILEHHLSTHP